METRKKIQYFKVKWVDISDSGNTWEPSAHFIGDPAKTALAAFRQKKASLEAAHEEEKAKLRTGQKRVVADVAEDGDVAVTTDDEEETGIANMHNTSKRTKIQHRKKQSDVWNFFESKTYDKTRGAYYSKCKLCGTDIKALNTTNQRAHLNSCHSKEMVQYKCDNNKVIFCFKLFLSCRIHIADLVAHFQVNASALPVVETSLNKYQGDTKKKIDRAFVIWCCKSARPLSMGETDKDFKKFILAATSGRYQPPSKKTALEELLTCVSVSRQITKADIHEVLQEDCLDICISGSTTIHHLNVG